MKKTIVRERKNVDNDICFPEDLDIQEILQKKLIAEIFLVLDSSIHDVNRIVIFQSERQRGLLENAKLWIIRCTFNSTPNPFFQTVSIHANFFGKFMPLAFILLKNNMELSYEKAFSKISERIQKKSLIFCY